MKKICFPIALVIVSLLQILQSSSDDFQMAKNRMFNKITGFKNIFKYFGKEMDEKAKIVVPGEILLKYSEAKPTFLLNLPHQRLLNTVNHKALEDAIRHELGKKEPILVGLDNLLINWSKNDGKIYLSRTGVIKAEKGYFIFRRNFAANNDRTQYIRLFKISEEDIYIFWKDEVSNQQPSTIFWINADEKKYYQFYFTVENEVKNAFTQIKCIPRHLYGRILERRKCNDLSVKEVFDNPENILDRKIFQKRTLAPKTSFRDKNEYDYLFESLEKYQNKPLAHEQRNETKKYLQDYLVSEKEQESKYRKQYQKSFSNRLVDENSMLQHLNTRQDENQYLVVAKNVIPSPGFQIKPKKGINRILALLQEDLDALTFEKKWEEDKQDPPHEHSSIDTTEDENSVLKKNLSFIFDDKDFLEDEKKRELKKLFEHSGDEHSDYGEELDCLNLSIIWGNHY